MRLRRAVQNAALAAGSIGVMALCLEATFRIVVPASDYPRLAHGTEVVRYEPNQTGYYRIRDEIAAPYAINAQGWNSGHATYDAPKPPGARRVAIIGDSFVEAFQVPAARSLAEQLERLPGRFPVEAFRIAISGAPFSHYLWMVEREAPRYRPDAVVVNLVHNDFDESYRPGGRYASSFQTLRADDAGIAGFAPPLPYHGSLSDVLIRSATLRYLRFDRQVTLSALLAALPTIERKPASEGGPAARKSPGYDGNIDVARVMERPNLLEAAIDAMVARFAALCRGQGVPGLLLMDGVRQAVYEDRDSAVLAINRLVAAAAARHGVDLVDLHPRFQEAWRRDHARFDHLHDGHWNERGHAVAAQAIRDWLDR